MKKVLIFLSFLVFVNVGFSQSDSAVKTENTILYNPEFPASFPKGEMKLYEFFDSLLTNHENLEGKVFISFVVEKDGELVDFKVMKSTNEILSKEALRVCKLMPKWEPGGVYSEGKKVFLNMRIVLPINFKKK